jgi:hypothetical protein
MINYITNIVLVVRKDRHSNSLTVDFAASSFGSNIYCAVWIIDCQDQDFKNIGIKGGKCENDLSGFSDPANMYPASGWV